MVEYTGDIQNSSLGQNKYHLWEQKIKRQVYLTRLINQNLVTILNLDKSYNKKSPIFDINLKLNL